MKYVNSLYSHFKHGGNKLLICLTILSSKSLVEMVLSTPGTCKTRFSTFLCSFFIKNLPGLSREYKLSRKVAKTVLNNVENWALIFFAKKCEIFAKQKMQNFPKKRNYSNGIRNFRRNYFSISLETLVCIHKYLPTLIQSRSTISSYFKH